MCVCVCVFCILNIYNINIYFGIHTHTHTHIYIYIYGVLDKLSPKLYKNENNTDISCYPIYLPKLPEIKIRERKAWQRGLSFCP